eukprot:TRINITY_DN6455_c0_g2_i2.p1 TRINITY_DN6455_c0_g2~~TRINITY_DN6455_c0_g2_i2.p1  ORF type:complete len:635 (-),score=116.99 TRINITY_DN6455_c0_g2_i2:115-2019(-)
MAGLLDVDDVVSASSSGAARADHLKAARSALHESFESIVGTFADRMASVERDSILEVGALRRELSMLRDGSMHLQALLAGDAPRKVPGATIDSKEPMPPMPPASSSSGSAGGGLPMLLSRSLGKSSSNLLDVRLTSPGVPNQVHTPDEEVPETEVEDSPRSLQYRQENHRASQCTHVSSASMFSSSLQLAGVRKPTAARASRMFADVEELKSRVRSTIIKQPKVSVYDLYMDTGIYQKIARSPLFEQVALFMTVINAIWIGVDTDWNQAETLVNSDPAFQIAENVFCCFFSFEIYVRFNAHKRSMDAMRDLWFDFDLFLVVMMVLETWVLSAVLLAVTSTNDSLNSFSNSNYLSIFRVMRLTRLARMARLIRQIPQLVIMAKGMASCVQSVLATLCILFILIYIFGIYFTQTMKDTLAGEMYFRTLPGSMNSLLAYGIIMENTPDTLNAIGMEHMFNAAVLVLFILLASCTVMNMLIGVLCETVRVVSALEHEQIEICYARDKLLKLLFDSGLDADGNQKISKSEFHAMLTIPDAAVTLSNLGVDVVALVDLEDYIFEHNTELDFAEFMLVILQLRGSKTATVKDVATVHTCLRKEIKKINTSLVDLRMSFRDSIRMLQFQNATRIFVEDTSTI